MRLISARRHKTDFEKKGGSNQINLRYEKRIALRDPFLKKYTDFSFKIF